MDSDLLKLNDYASSVGLHPSTVQRMITDGRLPGVVKVGRTWRIPKGTIPTPLTDANEPPPCPPQQATGTKPVRRDVPDNELTLKALAWVVNEGDATEAQEAQFARRIKTLQSVNSVAIIKGVVMTVEELKAKVETASAIEEKITVLEAKENFIEDREKYIATLQEEIDGKQADFRKEKRKWESIIEDFKEDLATLKNFYGSLLKQHPDAEKDLLPKLKLSEQFYAKNVVEQDTEEAPADVRPAKWSKKEMAEMEVGEDD